MSSTKLVCTACSCLCDDAEIDIENNHIAKIRNACIKGASFIYSSEDAKRRTPYLVNRHQVSATEAIEEAARLLEQARKPLIFGLDNTSLEAQAAGLELAQTLGAVFDDCSSFCHGALVEAVISGAIPSCLLPEVISASGLILYWGSNAHHSHPRHLSKFSYYPREIYSEAGWIPQVTLASIEVRDTQTTSLSRPVFKLKPGEDSAFIRDALAVLRGQGEKEQAKEFVDLIRGTPFCVIFAGLGLTYALDSDYSLFTEMVNALSELSRIAVIPMVGHFNMRGFNQTLYNKTGHANKVHFADGSVSHGNEFSFIEQVNRRAADCILILGTDPLSNLPYSLMQNLQGVTIICIDPFITPTTKAAQVAIGTAITGVETDGQALRMDGAEIQLVQGKVSDRPSDEEVLRKLLNRISR